MIPPYIHCPSAPPSHHHAPQGRSDAAALSPARVLAAPGRHMEMKDNKTKRVKQETLKSTNKTNKQNIVCHQQLSHHYDHQQQKKTHRQSKRISHAIDSHTTTQPTLSSRASHHHLITIIIIIIILVSKPTVAAEQSAPKRTTR